MTRILLVDDNEAMRYAVSHDLRGAGFEVTEVGTGQEALTAAASGPDVVLLDLKLPDISGFEVCRRLKTDPATSRIPIVQISASFLDQEARELSRGCGADAFIAQPATKRELLATIGALLRTGSEPQSDTSHQPAHTGDAELRNILQALREKNQTLGAILQASPIAVLALDARGLVTLWNRAAENIFGWSEREVLGRPVPFIPAERAEEFAHWQALGGNLQLVGHETVRLRKDGKHINVMISTASLLDLDGTPRGRVVLAEDVTLRRQGEALLLRSESLIATGRMAASLAHEINNPLASLVNLTYLLKQERDLPPNVRMYVDLAFEEVERISRITKHMLGVHREAPRPVAVVPAEILESVLDLYSGTLRAQGVRVERHYQSDASVLAFPGEMRQAFSNLVGNALHAMHGGGVLRVRVREGRDWHNGAPGVRISIADSGNGISAEHRPHIFEPFYTTKGEKGTGLGLWVVQQVIERAHGRIRLRSATAREHTGTCFVIFYPTAAVDPNAVDAVA